LSRSSFYVHLNRPSRPSHGSYRLALGLFFFFNDTATTEIYTLSLHDALPIHHMVGEPIIPSTTAARWGFWRDRKSTRLNSSHVKISYAVFCLNKKKQKTT